MALVSLSGINAANWPEAWTGGQILEGQSLRLTLADLVGDAASDSVAEIESGKTPLYLTVPVDTDFAVLADLVARFNIKGLALEFPTFGDGRGFSLAVRLRRDANFNGDVRATGHVIPDQALFLLRSGFDTADVPDAREAAFKAALGRFKDFYQTDVRGTKGAGQTSRTGATVKAAS